MGGASYTFGWAWQGAATADNIMLLNQALENEQYDYLFDRSVELGDDTVAIDRKYIGAKERLSMMSLQAQRRVATR